MKIKSKNITFKNGDKNINIFVTAYLSEKDKNLRGFANTSILTSDNKMIKQNNGYKIIEGKTNNLFLVEPRQKSYKDKDGNWLDGKAWFIEKRAIKEDLMKHILSECLVKDEEVKKEEVTTY